MAKLSMNDIQEEVFHSYYNLMGSLHCVDAFSDVYSTYDNKSLTWAFAATVGYSTNKSLFFSTQITEKDIADGYAIDIIKRWMEEIKHEILSVQGLL